MGQREGDVECVLKYFNCPDVHVTFQRDMQLLSI